MTQAQAAAAGNTPGRHFSEVVTLHSRRESLILNAGIEIGEVRATMDLRRPVEGKPGNEIGREQIIADADCRGLRAVFGRIEGFPHWLSLTILDGAGAVAFRVEA